MGNFLGSFSAFSTFNLKQYIEFPIDWNKNKNLVEEIFIATCGTSHHFSDTWNSATVMNRFAAIFNWIFHAYTNLTTWILFINLKNFEKSSNLQKHGQHHFLFFTVSISSIYIVSLQIRHDSESPDRTATRFDFSSAHRLDASSISPISTLSVKSVSEGNWKKNKAVQLSFPFSQFYFI